MGPNVADAHDLPCAGQPGSWREASTSNWDVGEKGPKQEALIGFVMSLYLFGKMCAFPLATMDQNVKLVQWSNVFAGLRKVLSSDDGCLMDSDGQACRERAHRHSRQRLARAPGSWQ